MDWDDVRVFLAVARGSGLTGAARSLNSSAQTVGRRVASLEAAIGAALFLRGPSGYSLTDDGRALLTDAERIEEDVARFRANASGRSTSLAGTVRVAAPETFVTELLVPALCPFLSSHRDLRVEFLAGVAPVSMARGDADLALRLVRPEHGDVTIRQIGTMENALYASKEYFELNRELCKSPSLSARIIGWDDAHGHLPAAQWLSHHSARRPDLVFTTLSAQRAAVAAGLGIALLPSFLAEGLEKLPYDDVLSETIWLVAHNGSVAADRVRIVYNELAHAIAAAHDKLKGHFA